MLYNVIQCYTKPNRKNGLQANSGFGICFDIGSLHLGCGGQNTSRIKHNGSLNPHLIYNSFFSFFLSSPFLCFNSGHRSHRSRSHKGSKKGGDDAAAMQTVRLLGALCLGALYWRTLLAHFSTTYWPYFTYMCFFMANGHFSYQMCSTTSSVCSTIHIS